MAAENKSGTAVLDAAALLLVLADGPGAGEADAALAGGRVSTVSVAEAMAVLLRRGAPPGLAATWLDVLAPDPVPFDREQAMLPMPSGLAGEPRAAIALARQLGVGLVTADPAVARAARGVGVPARLAG